MRPLSYKLRAACFLSTLILGATTLVPQAKGVGAVASDAALDAGFSPVFVASPDVLKASMIDDASTAVVIRDFCTSLSVYFKRYGWEDNPCGKVTWRADFKSKNGHPLIYAVFGQGSDHTLILGGVHADELTPIPIVFRFARQLASGQVPISKNVQVVVAPLVNPDGFMQSSPTRTNASGVDLNRNFLTMDWYAKAKRLWHSRYNEDPRHYPGFFPNSELETLFQIALVERFNPDKILSMHSPLGFLDYDGPGDKPQRRLTDMERKAHQLVNAISEKSENYRIVDYAVFPGSLGNFAGVERGTPTITLELDSSDPSKVEQYWRQFQPGLVQTVYYPLHVSHTSKASNASRFLGIVDRGSPLRLIKTHL